MGDQLGDQKRLTARFAETVKKAGKYFDENGLFLRVKEGGSKKWVQRYTFSGKRREMGLGSAKVISLAKARQDALKNLLLIREGKDPIQSNTKTTVIPTFEEVSQKVYEINLPSWRNKKHAAQFISTLKAYAFPIIGDIKVNDVETPHILRILTPIWLEKAETGRRVRQRVSDVLKYSIAQKWRSDNPADSKILDALPKQSRKQEHRKSISFEEVGSFINEVQNSKGLLTTKLALEFLILTATRSSEVRKAKWEEIEDNKWIIPAERMKAGVTHRVPLSSRCLKILQEAKSISNGSPYIFYGMRTGAPLSENTFSKLIKDLSYDAHVHGFRTSFRTWTQEKTNYSREIAEAALSHRLKDKAEAAYARSDLFEKRAEMMETWSNYVSNTDAKVISIRR